MKCKGVTKAGKACARNAVAGEWCRAHEPAPNMESVTVTETTPVPDTTKNGVKCPSCDAVVPVKTIAPIVRSWFDGKNVWKYREGRLATHVGCSRLIVRIPA